MTSDGKIIKVLHVIDSAGFGGGERYVLDLVKFASPELIHHVIIPHGGPLETQLQTSGCAYSVINMESRMSLKSVQKLVRLVNQTESAIIHSHGYRANLYGRLSAIMAKKKHVCTMHVSLYDYIDTAPLLRLIYLIVERITSFVTKKVICISSTMVNDALRLGIGNRKILLIHNGVNIRRFHPEMDSAAEKKELGIVDRSPIIGTVGRMVSEKGQVYLVEALVHLKNLFPQMICLFVGEGDLMPKLKSSAAELDVDDICHFTGTVEDIEKLYPLLDVFALPSLREPFGLVILEAMASGVSIVATNAGGPRDFIESGKNGMLALPGDSADLAAKISQLLSDNEKREQIAMAGLLDVRDRFTIEKMVGKIESVYKSL